MKSVLEQVPGRFIPADDLAPALRAYNAALADFGGRTFMSYRQEPQGGALSRLRLAEMDGDKVLRDLPITVPEGADGDSLEDPRLFIHDDRLHLAWTSALYRGKEWTCRQLYGELSESEDGWKVAASFAPDYGRNNGFAKEKNWQFFSVGGSLYAQYSPSLVIRLEGDKVLGEWKSPDIRWPWGKASGGTPPIPFADGQLITFFHAFEFDADHARRYNFAALVFEDRPPFRHVAVSVAPIVTASEADPIPEEKVWQPLCIFPCGAVRRDGEWLVAAGVNDERIAILRVDDSRLHLVPFDVTGLPAEMEVELLGPIVHLGEIIIPPAVLSLPRPRALEVIEDRLAAPIQKSV